MKRAGSYVAVDSVRTTIPAD